MKISKDKFYEVCKQLENNKTIYFLEKFNQEKSAKKLMFTITLFKCNHSYKKI